MSALAVLNQITDPGSEIREWRTTVGLTQAELSALSGVTQADISRIENGQKEALFSTLKRLTGALEAAEPKRSLANGGRRSAPTRIEPTKRWRSDRPTLQVER